MENKQIYSNVSTDYEIEFAQVFERIIDLIDEGQFKKAEEELITLHHADLADFIDNTNHKTHNIILPLIAGKIKPETLVWLSDNAKQSFFEILGPKIIANYIAQLDSEESIEVIQSFSIDQQKEILNFLKLEKRNQIIEGFTYAEDSAGRIMEKEFISFHESWSVGQAIDTIRKAASHNDLYAAIVVDTKFRPVGNILLSTLLKHPRTASLKELMNEDFKIAYSFTKVDEISFIFKQYALTIVPVVNKSGKLLGSISIDNMIYIIAEQAEKDIMQLGGINTQDTFYTLLNTMKMRFPWLFINLITAGLTSIIINQFSNVIEQLVILAVIMPIVASLGGNAATQAMTVTIRALANKNINSANISRIILKEILACGLNGILLAMVGSSIIFILFGKFDLSIIFAASVVINFFTAGFFGSGIPILLHNLNIDPATASGVCITVLTDALGFFIFLALAYFFLV